MGENPIVSRIEQEADMKRRSAQITAWLLAVVMMAGAVSGGMLPASCTKAATTFHLEGLWQGDDMWEEPPADPSEPAEEIPEESDFQITGGTLIKYNGEENVVRVPSNVKVIDTYAFFGNSGIKAVILPSSVTAVRRFAFSDCPSLRYIVFTKNVISISDKAIDECRKLTNIVAPKGSGPYEYARSRDIPVVVDETLCFLEKKVVMLPGDLTKNTLLNNVYPVDWKSSNKKVATVMANGRVRAKRAGRTVITAVAGGKKCRFHVVVQRLTEKNRVNQIIRTSVQKDMTKYQKIKAVHNWFIKNVRYDIRLFTEGKIPSVSHTSRGALVKGVAVCDGYAYAFQKVMKKLGIACRFVTGASGGVGHAWNMVKLGGKWYHVDVTFDDPIINGSDKNKTPFYEFFLKSSSVMKKSHSWRRGNYPACTSRKYD